MGGGPRAVRASRIGNEPARARRLGEELVRWFSRESRDLPWRRTRDPYRIWVAEVLLQQTRIEQALPYYERFLKAFPTVERLAAAPRERVMKLWEGAGYYARARHLHEAAREIVRTHGGRLPSMVEELERLPGFGPYTARSVAALAFGVPTVALDANGLRVLSRVFLLDLPPARRRARAAEVALLALGERPPREFTEALMELGQRHCVARAPRCPGCPVRALCRARAELPDPGSFPLPTRRSPRPRVQAAVGLLVRDGRVLVALRPEGGLLGGLWEFPGGKVERRERPEEAVLREFEEEVGIVTKVVRPLGTIEHDYTHFHVVLQGFLLSSEQDAVLTPGRRWATRRELEALPLPAATRRMLPWLDGMLSRTSSRGSGSRRGRRRA
jgi:A/G-specific adenine glycosylase